MRSITTSDGTELFCTGWGTGVPVLLLHGWTMGAAMWEYQIPFLASNGFRVITYDQRGCGRSGRPATGYDFDTLAADLDTVLNHLDLKEVSLVAFSMGAGVLARYASRYGTARIARASLVAPVTPSLLRSDDNPHGMDPAAVYLPFSGALAVDRPRALVSAAAAWFGASGVSEEMTQWALRLCDNADPVAMLELYHRMNEADFRPDLAALRLPVWIAHGTADVFAPPETTAVRTADAIPGATLELFDGASHGLFLTHREPFHAGLLAFLQAAKN